MNIPKEEERKIREAIDDRFPDEWISIVDMLPKESTSKILIHSKYGDEKGRFYLDEKAFTDSDGSNMTGDVTHWQPQNSEEVKEYRDLRLLLNKNLGKIENVEKLGVILKKDKK